MSAKGRLILAATLFLGWIGYLAYLVIRTRDPIILSRPQFYAAKVHVIASLTGDAEHPDARVTVKEVLYAADGDKEKLAGKEVTVEALAVVSADQGWDGPGDYLLPLEPRKDRYQLVPIPVSPTYAPPRPVERLRIYRATADTRAQWRQIEALLR
jgi:hypothetical protein